MENEIMSAVFSEVDTGVDELYHYGRKGMKWYQNIFTSGKERSVKRKRVKNLKKARKVKAEKEAAAKKAAEDQANLEAEKRKAIETGSASDVMKFKGKYTAAEMQYISTRLNWERSMSDLQAKEVASGKAKADDIMSKVGKMTDHVNTGAKAWNTFANIYNAFSNKEVPLPKIDTNITSGNKQERMSIKDKIKDKAEKKAREKEVKNTSASDALKNWDKYSTEERSAIVKNLNMRKTVKGMVDSEPSTSATTSESVTSKANRIFEQLKDKKQFL